MTLLSLALTLIHAKAFVQSPPHVLFLVDTSGSAFRFGYLRHRYMDFITDRLAELEPNTTVTCIMYDSSAAFYPLNRGVRSMTDIRPTIANQLYACQTYWKNELKTRDGKNLESASRGGTRLDIALKKALVDRDLWPNNASVTIYFLTDGGVDFRREQTSGKNKTLAVNKALNFIQSGMSTLCKDGRVKNVFVCGLQEQNDSVYPSMLFGNRSVVEQWMRHWLNGVPKAIAIDIP